MTFRDWLLGARPETTPEPEAKLTRGQAKRLLEKTEGPRIHPQVPGLFETEFDRKKCQHCGGLHVRKCPAVQQIDYHPDGKVARVVYFPNGSWDDGDVIWLEDVYAALEGGDDDGEG